jgi:hypothetical protein
MLSRYLQEWEWSASPVVERPRGRTWPRTAVPRPPRTTNFQITRMRVRRQNFIFAYIDQTSFMSQPVLLSAVNFLKFSGFPHNFCQKWSPWPKNGLYRCVSTPAQAPHVHRFLTIFRRTVPMAIPNLQDIAVNLQYLQLYWNSDITQDKFKFSIYNL